MLTLVYLQSCDPAQNRHRHYLVCVQRDLWGNMVVVKRWGRIGAAGWQGEQVISAASGEEAEQRVQKTLQRRRWHGYEVLGGG